MTFVYEKIREEDKEWVDFEQFVGLRSEHFSFGVSSSFWTVDRSRKIGLVMINRQGRPNEDEHIVRGCGLYFAGQYINFSVLYSEPQAFDYKYTAKWSDFSFNLSDVNIPEERKIQITQAVKEALAEYSKSSAYDEYVAVFDF